MLRDTQKRSTDLLKPDSRNRSDRIALAAKNITLAQQEKIRLEEAQVRRRAKVSMNIRENEY